MERNKAPKPSGPAISLTKYFDEFTNENVEVKQLASGKVVEYRRPAKGRDGEKGMELKPSRVQFRESKIAPPIRAKSERHVAAGRRGGEAWAAGRGWGAAEQKETARRCITKVEACKRGKFDSATKHAQYLLNHGGLDGERAPALVFGSDGELGRDEVLESAKKWSRDSQHFRIVISPEALPSLFEELKSGDEARKAAPDELRRSVEVIMRRMGKDLARKGEPPMDLEWLAAVHMDKQQPHVHVLLRGKANGKPFRMSPRYMNGGLANSASEELTREFGAHSEQEMKTLRARRAAFKPLREKNKAIEQEYPVYEWRERMAEAKSELSRSYEELEKSAPASVNAPEAPAPVAERVVAQPAQESPAPAKPALDAAKRREMASLAFHRAKTIEEREAARSWGRELMGGKTDLTFEAWRAPASGQVPATSVAIARDSPPAAGTAMGPSHEQGTPVNATSSKPAPSPQAHERKPRAGAIQLSYAAQVHLANVLDAFSRLTGPAGGAGGGGGPGVQLGGLGD